MAGSNSFKNPQKGKYTPVFDSAEVYKAPTDHQVTVSSILNGVLRPGETIDFSQEIKTPDKPKVENYLQREQAIFVNGNEQDTQDKIKKLQQEIKSLNTVTKEPKPDITKIALTNIPEANAYQINFLLGIVSLLRKDTSDSNSWVEISNNRKNKRNAFWNKAKSGGQKYQESGEHSASRSAN